MIDKLELGHETNEIFDINYLVACQVGRWVAEESGLKPNSASIECNWVEGKFHETNEIFHLNYVVRWPGGWVAGWLEKVELRLT